MKTLYGVKIGMTRVFDEAGNMVPVTVIKSDPHWVIQVKSKASDGYDALKVAFGTIRQKLVSKPLMGQFKKAGVEPCRFIREVDLTEGDSFKVGDKFGVGVFEIGEKVKVVGTSKGMGFQGAVRRHHFRGGPASHGQSDRMRAPGSVGASSYPSRTFKGQRMAGHMGDQQVTAKNVLIKAVEPEHNLIMVKGAVPGKPGGLLKIMKTER
jgi:large subunit ribosomal protein L3